MYAAKRVAVHLGSGSGLSGTREWKGPLLCTFAAVAACSHPPLRSHPGPGPLRPSVVEVEVPGATASPPTVGALLRRMSVEEKVGQVMMVGFPGQAVDAAVAELVRGRQVGGVCLFRHNIKSAEQVARLNDELRVLLADTVPPFIAVDQEGGNVVRVADGNLVLPGNMLLGATRDSALARQAGRAQGEDLRRLGFNMNLAPVLDVNVNPRNPVIGMRAFGDNADLVADLGTSFVAGQQEAQIATVAKHFPGHGSVDTDSHRVLPVARASAESLRGWLRPFEEASRAGLDGMMTAHIAAPSLSGDDTPATLSPAMLGRVLREELGFDGLVLTDELEMDAIATRYGVGRAAVLALNAGADMVLVPWRGETKTEVWQALREAVRSGEIPLERLDAAVRRILTVKLRRGVLAPLPPREQRLAGLGSERGLADTIARAGVTLLKDDKRAFPVRRGAKIAVITAEASLADAIAQRSPSTVSLVVSAYPRPPTRDALKRRARALAASADVVVVGVVNLNQLELATNAALSGRPVVVVVMGVPYLASMAPPTAAAILAVYSYHPSAAEAAAGALFGERGTPGKLPVAMPRMPFGFGLDPVGARISSAAPGR